MNQGIQTNFPDENLREYGCYYFDLLKWAEILNKTSYEYDDILRLFDSHKKKGWIESDCFIINPVAILNNCISEAFFLSITKEIEKPKCSTFIQYMKKPGHSHFVLCNNNEIWDSLDPNRPGVADYKIDSYRKII